MNSYRKFLKERGDLFNLKPHLPGENGRHWIKMDFEKRQIEEFPIGYLSPSYGTFKLTKINYNKLTRNYYFYFKCSATLQQRMYKIPALSKSNQWVYEYNVFPMWFSWLFGKYYYLNKTYDLTNEKLD